MYYSICFYYYFRNTNTAVNLIITFDDFPQCKYVMIYLYYIVFYALHTHTHTHTDTSAHIHFALLCVGSR